MKKKQTQPSDHFLHLHYSSDTLSTARSSGNGFSVEGKYQFQVQGISKELDHLGQGLEKIYTNFDPFAKDLDFIYLVRIEKQYEDYTDNNFEIFKDYCIAINFVKRMQSIFDYSIKDEEKAKIIEDLLSECLNTKHYDIEYEGNDRNVYLYKVPTHNNFAREIYVQS